MSTTSITELLARVSEIRKKHEMIANLTGERFNVFSILGLQSAENRTHSAFLRELLDPDGSHGLKDAFLKAFIRMLRKTHEHCESFRLDGWDEGQDLAAKVNTELHVGYKSEDLSRGERIDLVITPKSGSRRILIENKIYAGEDSLWLGFGDAEEGAGGRSRTLQTSVLALRATPDKSNIEGKRDGLRRRGRGRGRESPYWLNFDQVVA